MEIYLKEKCSDVCIKCKFSQLPSRPRTVTSAVVLIYDAPFPFFFFFARGWNGAGCLERCCYFKILQSWWKVAAQRWIASFVIKTLQQQTHPGVLIGAINKCRLVNLFFLYERWMSTLWWNEKPLFTLFRFFFSRSGAVTGLDCKYSEPSAVPTSSQIVSSPQVRNIIVHVHASTSSSAVLDDLSRAKVSQEGYV